MTTVAVLGTGRMGGSMAEALAGAGFQLVLYNRTQKRAEALAAELGATVAATAAEAAAQADVCISSVADGPAVAELYVGPTGVIEGLSPGSVVADMSTVLPVTILSLEAAIRARGAGVLDAPVSGSVTLARAGQLTIMAGGTAEDLERARPVLEAVASHVFHVGPLGSGAAMKLAVNAVVFGLNQALSEALVLAEAAGIERSVAYDVLAASAIGAPYVGYKRSAFMDPDKTPPAFSLALAEKDLRLIGELAETHRAAIPQARANLEFLREAESSHGPDADISAVASHLRRPTNGTARATAGAATAPRTAAAAYSHTERDSRGGS